MSRRYKDNLQAITNPIDKVKSLTGYTFTWNDKHEQFNGNNDIGVVAQEVEKVLPEIVDTRDNGYKAVKYEKLTYLEIINQSLQVMDTTASSLSMDNDIPLVVFNLNKTGNIKRVALGETIGTTVRRTHNEW